MGVSESIDWASGYYTRLNRLLDEGKIDISEVIQMYKDKKITKYQYDYAVDYLEATR